MPKITFARMSTTRRMRTVSTYKKKDQREADERLHALNRKIAEAFKVDAEENAEIETGMRK